jgi:hypothetical protein
MISLHQILINSKPYHSNEGFGTEPNSLLSSVSKAKLLYVNGLSVGLPVWQSVDQITITHNISITVRPFAFKFRIVSICPYDEQFSKSRQSVKVGETSESPIFKG